MNTRIKERLAALRAAMAKEGLAACYIPTADYHLSEYVGEHFKFRAWLSGFTGSAGTLVVLPDQAGLWTDGRYFSRQKRSLREPALISIKCRSRGSHHRRISHRAS